jgi:hypothetical protein
VGEEAMDMTSSGCCSRRSRPSRGMLTTPAH